MNKAIFGTLSTTILIGIFAICIIAQTPPPPANPPQPANPAPTATPGCPKLNIKTTTQPIREGLPVSFTAMFTGGDPKTAVTFDWYLSADIINKGQGTATIEVNSTGAGNDRAIIADLLVGGLAPECMMNASATAVIAGPAQKVDEYGTVSDEEEAARLDRLRSYMAPTDIGYVIAYAGRKSVRGLASANLRKIRAYLQKMGTANSNMAFIDGGYKEEASHELWLVQNGAEPPRANGTIDPKEIVFPKTTPVKRKP